MPDRTPRVSVRKTGAAVRPWEARCSVCRDDHIHLCGVGAVAVNTRGVGNRLWELAMVAAELHLRECHR